jgi:hypothetical protein
MFPSHIRISKAINIGAPKNDILQKVRDTASWYRWHPAHSSLNNPTLRFLQNTDSLIVVTASYAGKKNMMNGWQVYEHAGTDSVTLQWYIDFHLKWYPWQKFGSLFYENTYGAMMQDGLEKFKIQSEGLITDK